MPLEWSTNHPISVLMAGAAFLLLGVLAFFELEMEENPSADMKTISIIAELPGYPAEDIEAMITMPLENNLSGIGHIKNMESVSRCGSAKILLHFDWAADMHQSSIEVRECIDSIYPTLPSGMEKPLVMSSTNAGTAVILLSVRAQRDENIQELYSILSNDIRMRLQELNEVSHVSIQGLEKPEIHIEMDMDALSSRGISISETSSLISSYIIKKSAGNVLENNLQRLVTVESGINSAADLKTLQLYPGTSLKDIAEVEEAGEEQTSLFLLNGDAAWGFSIFKKASSGTIETAEAVGKLLPQLMKEYSDRLEFEIITDDSIEIRKNIGLLFQSLFWGITALLLVLTIIQGQFLPALMIALSIPFTLILNFFLLYIFKISLNTISLYGMIAAAGLIADNSIVVLHELDKGRDLQNVSSALITSTLTTVIVFLPPLLIPGPASVLLGDLVYTVIFTVSLSLPVSLFIIPACYSLLSPGKSVQAKIKDKKRISRYYHKICISPTWKISSFFLKSGKARNGVFLLLILSSLVFLKFIPFELFPEKKSRNFLLSASIPSDSSHEKIKNQALIISRRLRTEFSIQTVLLEAVTSADSVESLNFTPGNIHNSNQMNLLIIQDKKIHPDEMRNILQFCRQTLSLKDCILQPLSGSFRTFSSDPDRIAITADNKEDLNAAALPEGFIDSRPYDSQAYYFETDLQRLGASGLAPLTIHTDLNSRLKGVSAGKLDRGTQSINILVRAAEKYREDIQSLNKAVIGGTSSTLHLLGRFTRKRQIYEIYKENQNYVRHIIRLREEATENLEQNLPPGISILSRKESDMYQLVYLYGFTVILLFLILGIQTGEVKKTFILLSTLIPALWGGLFLLLVFQQNLNIYSFLGLLILQGTIINSGILLISSIDETMDNGGTIQEGSRMRLKPLAGSCLSTVAALFPILLMSLITGNGEAGMALTITGGLISGNLLMFFLLPAFYRSLVLQNGK